MTGLNDRRVENVPDAIDNRCHLSFVNQGIDVLPTIWESGARCQWLFDRNTRARISNGWLPEAAIRVSKNQHDIDTIGPGEVAADMGSTSYRNGNDLK